MAKGCKTGGRKKGTPNKITQDIKVKIQKIVKKEFVNIENLLSQLESKERTNFLIRLLPYVVPKQEQISVELEFNDDLENLTDEELEEQLRLLQK
ncbi:hypothetical protein OAT16_00340 [Prolixibacteraceae bacterium]|nr:hypothetical protein [Prolixibacteraceae bacterium]